MKPRVMSLVIFTCAVGYLTSNSNLNLIEAMTGIFLVALGAGAAGCLNMWYEADLDALMTRTCLRPIPTGRVKKNQALIFGILLSIFSVTALNYFANFLSALLLLLEDGVILEQKCCMMSDFVWSVVVDYYYYSAFPRIQAVLLCMNYSRYLQSATSVRLLISRMMLVAISNMLSRYGSQIPVLGL